jgi:polyferredoxin
VIAIGLLAVIPMIVPEDRRQAYRRITQLFGIFIFIFVVFTCLGVFGMIRNGYRGLMEIGRENIIALYFCSVPLTVMVTSMIFGPFFCGWICPTGALQEFAGLIMADHHVSWKRKGYPFSPRVLTAGIIITAVFLCWMAYLSITRIFFVEDSSIYWSEILILLLLLTAFKMRAWDGRLRRLRLLSFLVIACAAVFGWRITSPVHFTFSKVYDPASMLATVVVFAAAIGVSNIWCRYLCPWREAIAWAGKHSARRLETDMSLCTKCGKCRDVCHVDAVEMGTIEKHECHMCLKCVDSCPGKAIKITDKWSAEK